MQLPESLHPWRQWLEWFAPDYLPLFADLLGRLNPLLGPLHGRQQGGVPEPDGLGDLQRRGPYERLLSSEWLLAEELPDEFLRRAVEGEHVFLAPQYRARQANRLMVVLFDAGPLQLGAARLVHLALLMLLARRARQAGAELRWGILQDATPTLHAFDSVAHLRQLLDAATWTVVNDGHWQAWRAFLADQPQRAGECWGVGLRLPRSPAAPFTHLVQVQRHLDGQRLSVELQAGSTRQVTLPIPDARLAVPLLKGQFEGEVVRSVLKGTVSRVSLTLPPVISITGKHIALRLLDEPGMVVIRLPASEQQLNLQVHHSFWNGARTPLAVTFMSRTVTAVLSDSDWLWFWNVRGLRPVDKPEREQLQLPPGTANWLPVAWLPSRQGGRLFVLDTQGHLAYWVAHSGKAPAPPEAGKTCYLADNVLGLSMVDPHWMGYVHNKAGHLYAYTVTVDGTTTCVGMLGDADGITEVLFAANPLWRKHFGGCALGRVDNGRQSWKVVPAHSLQMDSEHIHLAPGWKGLGLVLQPGRRHYALVMMAPDKHSIGLWSQGQQQVLFTTTQPIARVSFCSLSGLVAVLTTARELLVYSVSGRTLVLQVMCNQLKDEHKERTDA